MKFAAVLIFVIVMITANISATLILAGNQMSAFAQRETNTGNVTSERIQEQGQLNAEERNVRSEINPNDREDRSSDTSDANSESERNPRTQDNDDGQITSDGDTSSSSQPTRAVPVYTPEVDGSNSNEVGSSTANEVGSRGFDGSTDQDQVNKNEITIEDAAQVRNIRGDAAYTTLVNLGTNAVAVAVDKTLGAIQEEGSRTCRRNVGCKPGY